MRSIVSNFLDSFNVRYFQFSKNLSLSMRMKTALKRAGYILVDNSLPASTLSSSPVSISSSSVSSNEICKISDCDEFDENPSIILSSTTKREESPHKKCLHLSSHLDELIELICYDGALQDAESDTHRAIFGQHLITPEQIFFSSESSLALVNIRPVLPGHALVIPRRRVPRFTRLYNDEVDDLWGTAQKIGTILETHYQATSLTLTIQDGPEAGQSVPHVHIHILPRNKDDIFQSNNDEIYQALDKNNQKQESAAKSLDPHKGGPRRRTNEEMAIEASLFRRLLSDKR
jgi:bis(5'-adenosyl)-triphosphatase